MKEEYDFQRVTASKSDLAHRTLLYGVGVNDSWYKTSQKVNGKYTRCPYYTRWMGILERGYCLKSKEKQPAYKEVSVCKEWHTFSNFRQWMETQDRKGKQLDKDIILPNNKVYSPDACVFVSSKVNKLLTDRGAKRGSYKKGVHFNKDRGKFLAQCNDGSGQQKNLGRYPTEQQAYEAYVTYKHALILQVASEQEDDRVKNGLLLHANILLESLNEENETLL
ncbi:hypothetical protein [Pseudoalteromonas phage J2-1]|uniref:Uncharacterized protein n=1 Tax=Pseudoalteromonas phage J2-1 TaxID=2023998 RepID=A0A223LGJ3_9CAUD|nr:HNH endonuclease [Pseudoalteromonas phage J2-1]ASU03344.1 hypothetical protein [Pseudoalteromonas phage J2-1]